MPRMIHPDVTDTIDASDAKVAIYQAQGWVLADQSQDAAADEVAAVTRASTKQHARKPAKKAAAKKTAAKKSK